MATRTADANLKLAAIAPALEQYFASFNAADYRAVADLFEPDGVLLAPFEDPIVGPEAIYDYLQTEAIAMEATPLEIETQPWGDAAENGAQQNGAQQGIAQQVVVKGLVKTRLFSVNVRWTFGLTAAHTIYSAEIKLLASLQELMQFDRG